MSERLWVQQDSNWNITSVINSSGSPVERYSYDPFGAVTILSAGWLAQSASSYAWKYMYQGGPLDSVDGTYRFQSRNFSPSLGEWIEQDPLAYNGDGPNLYEAFLDNPIVNSDPSGLAVCINSIRVDNSGGFWDPNVMVKNNAGFRGGANTISYGFFSVVSAQVTAPNKNITEAPVIKQEIFIMTSSVSAGGLKNYQLSNGGDTVAVQPDQWAQFQKAFDAEMILGFGISMGSADAFSDQGIFSRVGQDHKLTNAPGGDFVPKPSSVFIKNLITQLMWFDAPGHNEFKRGWEGGTPLPAAFGRTYSLRFAIKITATGTDQKTVIARFMVHIEANSVNNEWVQSTISPPFVVPKLPHTWTPS
jgi:RHS repeat-associated protein